MNQRYLRVLPFLLFTVCLLFTGLALAQCPSNIGFEKGNFDNWECSTGQISSNNGTITLSGNSPINGRHTIIQNNDPSQVDLYGGFPVSCPNGSGYSIQLGNAQVNRQVEQVSYTFTIPATQNNYSIIYNYAVVFQNPGHQEWEQPKFTANVFDVSSGKYIGCSSFSYAASSNLPGFKQSGIRDSVFYKGWTPVTIKLSGYAGKTIRLEFTTNDCTRGGHFGYAYVDVNENCSSPISGSVQCAGDTTQALTAPFGFAGYRWFNSDFSKLLDTSITLRFNPAPPVNSVFAVEVTPFPEQGCIDTVYATIEYSSEVINLKTPNAPIQECISNGVDLTDSLVTAGSTPGLSLSYYTDPSLTNYLASPKQITQSGTYYVKATNSAGCASVKAVVVNISSYPILDLNNPNPAIRPDSINLYDVIAGNTTGIIFTFWKDAQTTIPLPNPDAVKKTGTFYIKGTNVGGCSVVLPVTVVVGEPPILAPNAFSPNGDGVHDVWEVPVLDLYPECVVSIFNRLGQLLYRSTGYTKPWDGKYKGIDQPVGTYYYIIKVSAEMPAVGGSVTIIR